MDGVVQDHPRGDCFFLEGGPAGQERKGLISEVPCRQGRADLQASLNHLLDVASLPAS